MKIMVVASLYSSETPSGENLFVQNLIKTFEKQNVHYKLFIVDTGENSNSLFYKLKVAFIQIFNIGNSPLKAIKEYNPDIILVSNLFPNISTRWIKKNSVPILYFQHNFRINCIAGTFSRNGKECYSCIEKGHFQGIKYSCYKKSRLASTIASIRFFTKRNYRIEMKFPRYFLALHEAAVYPLLKSGIEFSKIKVLNNYLPDVKEEAYFGVRKSWLYCGRISEEKGIVRLLAIWPREHNLDIYGDGPMAGQIAELVKNKENIQFKGMIANEKLVEKLNTYIGAVVPSLWREGFPMVVLEYLRAGVPIITTKGNNVSQIVKLSKSGVEFQIDLKEELSKALETVASSREIFSVRAIQHFESQYSEKKWLKELMSIVAETISEDLVVK